MKLGYVCVNFNGSAVTLRAVQTLRQIQNHDIHVVVVDNGSREDELQMLRSQENATTTIISLDRNLGYFSGLNVGIKYLRDNRNDIEWMVVGNNDLEFPPDFCDKLEAITSESKIYPVISPDIITGDGHHQNPHVISHVSKIREIFYDIYYSNYYLGMIVHALASRVHFLIDRSDELEWRVPRLIYQGHGSAYILGPRFFELFEELWAPTFLMSEEFFLSKQLSDVGYKVYYDPRIQIQHTWHATLDALPSRRRWEFARNAHRVYRLYVGIFK